MRVIFVNRFPQTLISGGIKKFYRCAEILRSEGLDAWVWQPGGAPAWLRTTAATMADPHLAARSEDVLVIPEVLDDFLAGLARDPRIPRKVLFCQNQYYLLNRHTVGRRLDDLGFGAVFCPSRVCADFVSRVFHQERVSVVPSSVDPALFVPGAKRFQIACAPRKLAQELGLIRSILVTKYPEAASVPWIPFEGVPEEEVARILGESAVYFSTSHQESLGILPLEAMSAGCAVVGFHGYGGLEYATAANGQWFSPEDLEEAADALWDTLQAVREDAPALTERLRAGMETAAGFRPEATRRALLEAMRSVIACPLDEPRVHRVSCAGHQP
jgi:glycosyltransferase involved in cell wall biosynthesis